MPLQLSDLGKRVTLRDDNGQWLPACQGTKLIGLEHETERPYPWRKTLRWARVRFSNGSIWRLDVRRVRVIDDFPDPEQPPCLPGTTDAVEEEGNEGLR